MKRLAILSYEYFSIDNDDNLQRLKSLEDSGVKSILLGRNRRAFTIDELRELLNRVKGFSIMVL